MLLHPLSTFVPCHSRLACRTVVLTTCCTRLPCLLLTAAQPSRLLFGVNLGPPGYASPWCQPWCWTRTSQTLDVCRFTSTPQHRSTSAPLPLSPSPHHISTSTPPPHHLTTSTPLHLNTSPSPPRHFSTLPPHQLSTSTPLPSPPLPHTPSPPLPLTTSAPLHLNTSPPHDLSPHPSPPHHLAPSPPLHLTTSSPLRG